MKIGVFLCAEIKKPHFTNVICEHCILFVNFMVKNLLKAECLAKFCTGQICQKI